jgi:hypothetical protein
VGNLTEDFGGRCSVGVRAATALNGGSETHLVHGA